MMRKLKLLLPLLLVAFGSVCSLAAQDDASAKKKPDPEVQKKLKEFEKAIKDRKFKRDAEAIQTIDEMLAGYEDLHSKDQQSFVKSLQKVFAGKKRKPDNTALYRATIAALGTIGGAAPAKILNGIYDKKPFSEKEWLSTQEEILENIGKTKYEPMIKFLIDEAKRDPIDGIKRAAGKALRHFKDTDYKTRREIYQELVKNYGQIEGEAEGSIDPGDAVAATRRRTLTAIRDPWNGTLSAISGQNYRKASEWVRWWNKNKNNAKAWQ